MFIEMKDEVNRVDFFLFLQVCWMLWKASWNRTIDIEGNDIAGKIRVLGAVALKKAVGVRKALFKYLLIEDPHRELVI